MYWQLNSHSIAAGKEMPPESSQPLPTQVDTTSTAAVFCCVFSLSTAKASGHVLCPVPVAA